MLLVDENGHFIPQHVQNIVIRDYANKNNLLYKLSSSEYILKILL